jgi:uncharacterized protein (DUF608 family)
MHAFNGWYDGEHLNHVAFPMGGIGAGTVCLNGNGALSKVSLRGQPAMLNDPMLFAAVCVRPGAGGDPIARVLEGPVPAHEVFGRPQSGFGSRRHQGLPRFGQAAFRARVPFGIVQLRDDHLPLAVQITGWSPFIPNDEDASSLPVLALEYELHNETGRALEVVFSFHSVNFLSDARARQPEAPPQSRPRVRVVDRGFVLDQPAVEAAPFARAALAATIPDDRVRVDGAWFRGNWFDALTLVWKNVSSGAAPSQPPISEGQPSPGGSLYLPLTLQPGERATVPVLLAWHVPVADVRYPSEPAAACGSGCGCSTPDADEHYRPWYTRAFADVDAVTQHWQSQYADLRRRTQRFSDCFYDTTLPPEVIEAVAANLMILKTPTLLRQRDGRVWGWEGCGDDVGCCAGSCTHVWNYAQAMPHLFSRLERTLRDTEFGLSQNDEGKQAFRSALPLRQAPDFSAHAAADGQLGGIIKVYRDWRISGDTDWLRRLWPAVKQSLRYCIQAWDPGHEGAIKEPHHNTYDIEFWGADGMCTSFYVAALAAAVQIGQTLGDDVTLFEQLLERGRRCLQQTLFNGEYFVQQVQWTGLRAKLGEFKALMGGFEELPEAQALIAAEGPKYQYGRGCLADGVLGAWMAQTSGLNCGLDDRQVRSHLLSVHRHNLKHDLSTHANPQRSGYTTGHEGGLLLCSWPQGGKPSLPFVYSDEVWTGIEYQVASHLMMHGCVTQGLDIVRLARQRYNGRVRNPFDEYECGHWYARAMSSYALLQGMTGARYDAVTKMLSLAPWTGGDFRTFVCTATGYGTAGLRDGQPFCDVVEGEIDVQGIACATIKP